MEQPLLDAHEFIVGGEAAEVEGEGSGAAVFRTFFVEEEGAGAGAGGDEDGDFSCAIGVADGGFGVDFEAVIDVGPRLIVLLIGRIGDPRR